MSANELMAAEAADAEALLDNLTLEELERLEWEMNEVARAPAHMQSTYSVDKAPTGLYSRNKLMLYLREEALKTESEHGSTNGSAFGDEAGRRRASVPNARRYDAHPNRNIEKQTRRKSSRARKRKKKKVDVDAEIEAMVDGLTEAELHELLAEYEAQASFDSMAALLAEAARGDGENETDLVATLEGIQNNDKYFKRINLNNHREVTPEYVVDLISALQGTHTVRELSLSNLGLGDSFAAEMGRILASNTSIQVLNLETNNITAEGVVSLVEGCSTNTTLKELRLENQRHQTGIGGEARFVDLLDRNESIVKLGYTFESTVERIRARDIVMRNVDAARRERVATGKTKKKKKTSGGK